MSKLCQLTTTYHFCDTYRLWHKEYNITLMDGKVAQNAMIRMRFSFGLFQITLCGCSEYRHFKSDLIVPFIAIIEWLCSVFFFLLIRVL